ncbi:MAG: VanZ family protein [Lactobacillaceae bacterium]|jgi:glycopeptide antibiotics resistance protein|nr:VanZ family protein [Lactobacillaceae bacterium]
MYDTYLESIQKAILIFPFIWILLTVPIFAFQYHRLGALSVWRIIIISSFTLYLLTLLFLIVFPLPTAQKIQQLITTHARRVNLNPLELAHNLKLVYQNYEIYGWRSVITDSRFFEPVFNVIMMIPFGVYLRYYFKKSFSSIVVLAFMLSMFFEVTQLTGNFGMFARSYRLFDVDDILTNTFGAIIGFILTPIFRLVLPNLDQIDDKTKVKSNEISFLRRTTAFIIDFVIFTLIALMLPFDHAILKVITSIIITWTIPTFIASKYVKKTIGMRIVSFGFVNQNEGQKLTISQILVRQLLGVGGNIFIISSLLVSLLPNTNGALVGWFQIGLNLILFGLPTLYVVVDISALIFKKDHQLWFEKLSKTILVADAKISQSSNPKPPQEFKM